MLTSSETDSGTTRVCSREVAQWLQEAFFLFSFFSYLDDLLPDIASGVDGIRGSDKERETRNRRQREREREHFRLRHANVGCDFGSVVVS